MIYNVIELDLLDKMAASTKTYCRQLYKLLCAFRLLGKFRYKTCLNTSDMFSVQTVLLTI